MMKRKDNILPEVNRTAPGIYFLNIHQCINARSWYAGEPHPEAVCFCGKRAGVEYYTPVRIRITAPYKIPGLKTSKPRGKNQFYQMLYKGIAL